MTRNALIYGGAGAIGAATATRLAATGFSLHLVGRDADKLAAVAGPLGAGATVGDVTDPALFARAIAESGFSSLDALVYAVGTITLKPLPRLAIGDLLQDFQVNAVGAAMAVQAALPAMKAAEAGASVVLFSSVAVAQGFTAHTSISMAKGAVEGLTRALGAELAPKIRVNCIAPSLTRTPLAKALTSNEPMAKAIGDMHALQRLGEAVDVAALAAFLAGPESGWISGQVMAVDGGRSRLRTKG
ncbi:FabG Dehydrogenases with different specificities (related to short-chain alcohol dehydrogenases) [Rhabdaerophilaceae bacterium]